MNRFGVLCDVSKNNKTIIEIIIAKNSQEIKSEVNLDDLKIGDNVNIEVLGRKFELNDKKISVIGRIVLDATQNRALQRSKDLKNIEKENETESIYDDLTSEDISTSDNSDLDEDEENEDDVDENEDDPDDADENEDDADDADESDDDDEEDIDDEYVDDDVDDDDDDADDDDESISSNI